MASPPGQPVVVLDDFNSWEFAVGPDGAIYSGTTAGVTRYHRGSSETVVARPAGALSVGRGTIGWVGDGIVHQLAGGKERALLDAGVYEATNDPDAGVSYGLQGLDAECAQQVDPALLPTFGTVGSRVSATVTTPHGVYVADEIGSSILYVDRSGAARTVAVLPPHSDPYDEYMADVWELPECARSAPMAKKRYPIDMELGPNGDLYVLTSSDVTFIHIGSVLKVNAATGAVSVVAQDVVGRPGDLAVGSDGTLYLTGGKFGDEYKQVRPDGTITWGPNFGGVVGIVEWSGNRLYATVAADHDVPFDQVMAVRPRR